MHVGEVAVAESGDLLGYGVNVAARLEALAQPGMALVSRAAADLVRGDLDSHLVPCSNLHRQSKPAIVRHTGGVAEESLVRRAVSCP